VRIYLDHNSTTPLHPAAAAVWQELAREGWPANPSSIHWAGRAARRRLTAAREKIAQLLGVSARELFFTASGTEANVTALRGAIQFAPPVRRRVLVSGIEHPSVLSTLDAIARERSDLKVERMAVDRTGVLDLKAAEAQLAGDVFLVSLMLANNETGALQPVSELALRARALGALVHCDAAQAIGKIPVDIGALGADLVTGGGHKFGAGLGLGMLVIRGGVPMGPLLPGHQESGRRGGTENVAAAVAAAAALEAAIAELGALGDHGPRIGRLRDRLEQGLLDRVPATAVHAADAPRLPNTSAVRFSGAEGEAVLIGLDLEGIAVSTGAACAAGSIEPSHVLLAMGMPAREAASSIRFSLGASTSEAEIDHVLEVVPRVVTAVRRHTSDREEDRSPAESVG
jgi:cysteine desulfurase